MRARLGLLIIVLILVNLSFVPGEISLSQPSIVYNYGDLLSINARVSTHEDKAGFFELNLNCGEENNFYRQYLNLAKDQEKEVNAELLLLPSLADKGNCEIKAIFANENKRGSGFLLSDLISIEVEKYASEFEAGKTIVIEGTAVKENSQAVEGFYDFVINESGTRVYGEVNSKFIINFSFPENTKAQEYTANLRIYEGLYGEITNQGYSTLSLIINQTPKGIYLSVPESILPGESTAYSLEILDQAGDKIQGLIELVIFDKANKPVLNKTSSGEEEITFNANASVGIWRLEARYGRLFVVKNFTILELEKASFEMVDNILVVKNIGNVVYNNPIEISIGDYKETKNLEIAIGGTMEFRLKAPDGTYDVKVSDGQEAIEGNVALTGRSISIEQFSELGLMLRYPIVWVFLILVLGVFIVLYSRKIIKRTSYSVPVEEKETSQETVSRAQERKGFEVVDVASSHAEKAEHSLVLEGRKEDASLVTIKIANLDKTKKVSAETLSSIYKAITNKKGSVFESGEFIIGLFSSLNTRTFKNEMPALHVAREIETLLKAHNRKFREKIDYGIGLSLGEIIAKKESKSSSLRFTALGNSLIQAKNTAELALGDLLLSDNMQKKVAGEVRTELVVKNGVNLYSVKAIMDRDKNKGFISGFLERQRKS